MRGFLAHSLIPRGLVLALLLAGSLWARPAQPPFRNLDIGLQLAANTNREEIHRYWRSHPALGVVAETPFYVGLARAGILVHHFSALSSGTYDYTDAFLYIGWGIPFVRTQSVRWVNAIDLGAHVMIFTNPESANNKESEMGIGMTSLLRCRLKSRWSLAIACSYNRMFTWKRVDLAYISGGLNYLIETPAWLRNMLE